MSRRHFGVCEHTVNQRAVEGDYKDNDYPGQCELATFFFVYQVQENQYAERKAYCLKQREISFVKKDYDNEERKLYQKRQRGYENFAEQ